MRTSKPISTISYNSVPFLCSTLSEMIKNHVISNYVMIFHKKEKDEKKDHIHLLIFPNKLLDTMDIQESLVELNPLEPTKPFKCIDFRTSVIDDWILYAEHFAPYLDFKSQSREFHYSYEDFIYYDEDAFDDLYAHAHKGSDFAHKKQILTLMKSGINPADLIGTGTIPLNMACNLRAYSNMLTENTLNRNGRANHEEQVNEQT